MWMIWNGIKWWRVVWFWIIHFNMPNIVADWQICSSKRKSLSSCIFAPVKNKFKFYFSTDKPFQNYVHCNWVKGSNHKEEEFLKTLYQSCWEPNMSMLNWPHTKSRKLFKIAHFCRYLYSWAVNWCGWVVCWLSGSEIYLSTAVPLTFPHIYPTCISPHSATLRIRAASKHFFGGVKIGILPQQRGEGYGRFRSFLAMLVALHFTPVSESLSGS